MTSSTGDDPDFAPGLRSPGEIMVSAVLDASAAMHPDDVEGAAVWAAEAVGAADVALYIVDLSQRYLTRASDPEEVIDVETSMAGRAFRAGEPVIVPTDDGRHHLWIPILDGSDRLGVMSVVVDVADDLMQRRLRDLAGLMGEIVVSKRMAGDGLVRAQRRKQITLAAEMRWSLLPPLTVTTKRARIGGLLEPAEEIAGDAFDYAFNGDLLHFAVFDAMGHGLTASRLCNLAVFAYRHARRRGLGLVDTYAEMDALVTSEFGRDHFVTAQLAVLDLSSGRLQLVNAGHPRPLLVRDDSVTELDTGVCLPVGIGATNVEVTESSLQPGDQLLFFSDGMIEARSPEGEEFGRDRLADHLRRAGANREKLPETVRRLVHAALAHCGSDLGDDATAVLLEWLRPDVPVD